MKTGGRLSAASAKEGQPPSTVGFGQVLGERFETQLRLWVGSGSESGFGSGLS